MRLQPMHGYALAQRIKQPSKELPREVNSFEQMLKGISLVLKSC